MIRYYGTSILKPDGYSNVVAAYLKEDIQDNKRMIFIPANPTNELEISYQIEKHLNYFKQIGIEFVEYIDITKEVGKENLKELIINASVIILGGGNPIIQMNYLIDHGLDVLIKQYNGVIMGFSAGSMCMSEYSVLTPVNEEMPDFDIRSGLQLDKISVISHFNIENDIIPEYIDNDHGDGYHEVMQIEDLYTASSEVGRLYLISDHPVATFIRCDDNGMEIIDGACYILENRKINKYESINN